MSAAVGTATVTIVPRVDVTVIESSVREGLAAAFRQIADELSAEKAPTRPRFEAALSLDGTGTWDVLDHERQDVIQVEARWVAESIAREGNIDATYVNGYAYGPSSLYPKGI